MTRKEKAARILAQLDELYPTQPIPLDHTSPFTLLIAVLLVAFVAGGTASLRRCHAAWWWIARVGAVVIVLGDAAFLFLDVPWDFKAWWWPGDDFKLFSFGSPLLLPLLHLELEHGLRR